MRWSWQARLSAMESPRPRVTATSILEGFFGSSGSRARLPASAGRSLAKPTSSSLSPEIARMHTVTERLKASVSEPFFGLLRVLSPGPAIGGLLSKHDVGRAFRQVLAEGALIELGHHRPLQLVALVQEGQPESHADIAEDLGVLGPGDDRARAHHGRQVAVDEGRARHVRDAHHLVDDVLALGVAI